MVCVWNWNCGVRTEGDTNVILFALKTTEFTRRVVVSSDVRMFTTKVRKKPN